MKEGDLVRHLMDDQTGVIVLAWGVMGCCRGALGRWGNQGSEHLRVGVGQRDHPGRKK